MTFRGAGVGRLAPGVLLQADARSFSSALLRSRPIVAFMLVPFFKSSLFDSVPTLASLSNTLLVVEALLLGVLVLLCGFRDASFGLLGLYFVWVHAVVPLLTERDGPSLYYMFQALGFFALVLLGSRTARMPFLDVLSGTAAFMVLLNSLLLLFFPNGVTETPNGAIWLFGIRTGFPLVVIPSIVFCLAYDCLSARGKWSLRTWVVVLAGSYAVLDQWVATGIVQLVALWLLMVWMRSGRTIHPLWASLVVAGVALVIVLYRQVDLMGGVLGLLERDTTFTGRTEIWDEAIREIEGSPFLGLGGDSAVSVNGEVKALHSHWLFVAHEGGLIGLVLQVLAYGAAISALSRIRRLRVAGLLAAGVIVVLIGAIVEIQTYFPFVYGLLALAMTLGRDVQEANRSSLETRLPVRGER